MTLVFCGPKLQSAWAGVQITFTAKVPMAGLSWALVEHPARFNKMRANAKCVAEIKLCGWCKTPAFLMGFYGFFSLHLPALAAMSKHQPKGQCRFTLFWHIVTCSFCQCPI